MLSHSTVLLKTHRTTTKGTMRNVLTTPTEAVHGEARWPRAHGRRSAAPLPCWLTPSDAIKAKTQFRTVKMGKTMSLGLDEIPIL